MKRILVMSDTHGNKVNIDKALQKYGDADCIIHLGDYVRDAEYIRKLTDKKVYSVKGNCDFSAAKPEILLRIEGKSILALHGHRQGVKDSLLALGLYAVEKGADLVLFGHTHTPLEDFYGSVVLYNPGSLGEPRGRKPSLGVVTIEDGEIRIKSGTV
jgi:putative phosphoesterase